ncbi:uncharacterized protein LOC100903233 [Galendromus occidentalis]|uniref:Uncharacterized protein LOC100903233 n=1 Tax=Galendromus occidentalis TaxID=34638 RepID=A0AAJ7WI94_9ACAR|nr:uncharacterized protein LOC100903233 [Galendromus occidentalis]
MSYTFSQKTFTPKAPEKGSFPLDHDGDCKKGVLKYLLCLQENASDSTPCKDLAKEYLRCRMENELMAKEEWSRLGFSDDKDSVGARLAPLCRKAVRSMCDKPSQSTASKQKTEKDEQKTSEERSVKDEPEQPEDHINKVTGEIDAGTMKPTMNLQYSGMQTTAAYPTGYPGYPYYPSTMPPPQQFMQPNVLATQFPAIQAHAVPQAATPTQIPAPIQQMAAPFQPGIAPPPLTPQSQTGTAAAAVGTAPAASHAAASCVPGVSGAAPTVRPASAMEAERPPQEYYDDQYDHRCSLCIAAWGFAFLCGLTGAAGFFFVQQASSKLSLKEVGILLLAVSGLLFSSIFLFLPASSKYAHKLPVHRQCLPFLLVLIASGELCWVVYLIAQEGTEGKGILVALGGFLGMFWCSLWKIMCLRCCCHRRRICAQKKAQARLEQQTKRRKRRGSDPDEFETDFHHVNTQVRETLRNRFNESILQQTIIQSAAPTLAIGADATSLSIVTQTPSAPPADPTPPHSVNPTGTLTTFSSSGQSTSAAGASSAGVQQAASAPQVHDPPPYDAVYRRTPPPPYSTLV